MNNQRQILMVDDDREFCSVVKDYLTAQGFQTDVVYDGIAMKQYLSQQLADLIILDVMLPGEDGLSLARWLRVEHGQIPIIMFSAAGDEVDRVLGLELGADHYLTKPTSLRELLAHIRAVLRIATPPPATTPATDPHIYTFGHFVLNTASHSLVSNNDIEEEEITITAAEYELLLAFVTHPNQVLSRDRLMNLTRGYDHNPFDRSIDVRVRRLRTKIESDPGAPRYIRTIRGEGYLFSPQGGNKENQPPHEKISKDKN